MIPRSGGTMGALANAASAADAICANYATLR
jgi:hypothetical protein